MSHVKEFGSLPNTNQPPKDTWFCNKNDLYQIVTQSL